MIPFFDKQSHPGRKLFSVAMLLLAGLLLIASCPLKHVVRLRAQTLAGVGFPSEKTADGAGYVKYGVVTHCTSRAEPLLVNTAVPTAQNFVPVLKLSQFPGGFLPYYFNSGVTDPGLIASPVTLSQLPLFLKQRRLLI
jgi:hypothetical protein